MKNEKRKRKRKEKEKKKKRKEKKRKEKKEEKKEEKKKKKEKEKKEKKEKRVFFTKGLSEGPRILTFNRASPCKTRALSLPRVITENRKGLLILAVRSTPFFEPFST